MFTPTALGAKTATVNVASNGAGTQYVSLSGTGTTTYTVAPPSLAFGNEQRKVASAPMPITVTNTGNVPLSIRNLPRSGTDPEQFTQTNTCGTPVPVGSTCTINVVFTPASLGSKSATLSVTSIDGGTQPVALSGTGVR
jgi:hypothetical protein